MKNKTNNDCINYCLDNNCSVFNDIIRNGLLIPESLFEKL